ncbi:glycosyltransferase family 2 protein [Aestuariirhabdus sp. LZHN29]|uniref:glycosyltransferase family 2 protein n=1 Tax=Aestuariirhabdus sp. LZHN29 TaxID=3417462 RepID=UPI003CF7D81F
MPTNIQLSIVIPCYNCRDTINSTVQFIRSQILETHPPLEIILVDDGSSDTTPQILKKLSDPYTRVLTLKKNQGRSSAINRGAKLVTSDAIMIIDSDCYMTNPYLISKHLKALSQGASVVFGQIFNSGAGFWARYQNEVAASRLRIKNITAQTTAHFSIHRELFFSMGGFPTCYSSYGFEDKDFLCQISNIISSDKVQFLTNSVEHRDDLSLSGLCGKLIIAAQYSAPLFHRRHPDFYEATPYGKLDLRCSPSLLSNIAFRLSPIHSMGCRLVAPLLEQQWIPFGAKKLVVRLLMALAYASGCADR